MNNSDEKYMKMALSLARRGAGSVAPNPMVGCVIVKNDRVVARGYHRFFGGPHAEADAIGILSVSSEGKSARAKSISAKLCGATLYVNLEPCRHTNKKTPPCIPLIIKSGVKKVVAGMKDPNSAVSGRGLADLRRAGIKTVCGVFEGKCRELNKVYVKNISCVLPYVIIKTAMTLDGKIAAASGDSKWISSDASRRMVHGLRATFDAVLVGAGAVIEDDPRLTARIAAGRIASGKNPVRVVIDPSGRSPAGSRIFDSEARTMVVTTADGARCFSKMRRRLNLRVGSAEFIILEKRARGGFDFKEIMKELFRRGIKSVLVEGGGETNWGAVKSGVADEYLFFVAPKIIGGRGAKSPVEGEGFDKIASSIKLTIKKIFRSGGDIVITAVPADGKSEGGL
ncbi:MAG: bifunctional diaminohydroxyphosphoribosylaminopyrimidine deaminase/5-amino-6-(5-phosphoribosylamino)uracil reductase RibD [Endomicrobiia bacterium]|nr:bifunctional diaminohydroxyphosphoribosylaminopyrimidine deaminase/5-amino-6-(5-phosphoribosylamino)uracil reductase RibD [Endomicrobiia bacterium]